MPANCLKRSRASTSIPVNTCASVRLRLQDDKHFAGRIDPQRGAGKTRMAKRAERKKIAAICGKTGVNVPSQTACPSALRDEARSGHLRDCQGTQYPNTSILAAVQNHLTVDRQIVRSRKESRMARDATHAIRRGIVNLAPQPFIRVSLRPLRFVPEITQLAAALFRRRNASAQFRLRAKTRVAHSQRDKDISERKLVECKAASAVNNFTKRDVVDIAINEFGSRRIPQRLANESLDRFVITSPAILQIKVGCVSGAVS